MELETTRFVFFLTFVMGFFFLNREAWDTVFITSTHYFPTHTHIHTHTHTHTHSLTDCFKDLGLKSGSTA